MHTQVKCWHIVVAVMIWIFLFGPHPRTQYSTRNAFESFKHYGPHCDVSSADLYQPRSSQVCPTRISMLEAMSSGGRIGKDAPYAARGCDMEWFSAEDVCRILDRFSQVVFVGDSMLRHVLGAINILVRKDLGHGAVTDWNFDEQERHQCFCLNQFNVKTCSVQGIYKTADVLKNNPESLVCPKIIQGWQTDLRIEQINKHPMAKDELERLRQVLGAPSSHKPAAYILGHGLWSDLNILQSMAWLESVVDVIAKSGAARTPPLLVTPNAAGKDKEDQWLVSQGNKALVRFEEAMAMQAQRLGVEHLGTWNMSIQATMYDGVHMDMRGNLLKAMMVVNWLNYLDAR